MSVLRMGVILPPPTHTHTHFFLLGYDLSPKPFAKKRLLSLLEQFPIQSKLANFPHYAKTSVWKSSTLQYNRKHIYTISVNND